MIQADNIASSYQAVVAGCPSKHSIHNTNSTLRASIFTSESSQRAPCVVCPYVRNIITKQAKTISRRIHTDGDRRKCVSSEGRLTTIAGGEVFGKLLNEK